MRVDLFLAVMSAGQCWSDHVMTSLHSCQKILRQGRNIFTAVGPTFGSEVEVMSTSHSCTPLSAHRRSVMASRNKLGAAVGGSVMDTSTVANKRTCIINHPGEITRRLRCFSLTLTSVPFAELKVF